MIATDVCALPPYHSQWTVMMLKMSLILFVFRCWTAEATYDMNLGEMQYIADHLTMKQCRQLIEALDSDTVLLGREMTGADVPDVSCIRLLMRWDRMDGRGQSFTELSIRLKQIGRKDVADALSSSVYGEKINAIDNEMSKINHLSVPSRTGLLSQRDQSAPNVALHHDDHQRPFAIFSLTAIILGIVALVLVVAYFVLRRRCNDCKVPKFCVFLKENVPIYLFGASPKHVARELVERNELLLAEGRAAGNPYIV